MSYFANNKLYSYYEIDKSVIGSQDFTEEIIEIINNESVLFDLTKMNVWTSSLDVLNSFDVDTIKIHIDWGDGKTERLSKPLISNKSTIGVYKPNEWKIVEHVFVVDKTSRKNNVITITAFNSFDEKLTVKIPYTVIYKTIYDLGSEFSLFSANTTNTNKVSYTLKQNNSDSMMILSSVDEKEKLFGKDSELDEDNFVNTQFSDEFIDQDFMVWDWNTLPTIIFNDIELKDNAFVCSFKNEGIEVESWYPQVKLISDKDDEQKITITKDDTNFQFEAKCEADGIYEIFLSPLTGMNGSSGQSQKTYVKKSILSDNPRHIRQIVTDDGTTKIPVIVGNRCMDFSDVRVTSNQNKLVFNFTLADPYQLKSLTKLDLILQAVSVNNTSYDFINDISFKYDVLSSLFDDNGNPKYIKDQDGKIELQYVIRMKDIPDTINYNGRDYEIGYEAWFETNDVLGGDDNTDYTLYDEELGYYKEKTKKLSGDKVVIDEYDSNNKSIVFNYQVGKFKRDSVTTSERENGKIDKLFNLSWEFTPYDYWENFIVNAYTVKQVSEEDENGVMQTKFVKDKLLMNDYHNYYGNNIDNHVFSGISYDIVTDDETGLVSKTFNKIIDGNLIPDGYVMFDVIYRSEMNDYYDEREVSSSTMIDYRYPRTEIEIDNIRPYITIDYDKNKNTQSLKLNLSISGSTKEQLREIYLTKQNTDNGKETTSKVSKLEFEDLNIPFVDSKYQYTFEAFNKNDTQNRKSVCTPKQFVIQSTENTEVSALKELPSDGKDYLSGDISKQFLLLNVVNDEGEHPIVDWTWVKQNTLHDIDKFYRFTFDDKLYYSHQYGNCMAFDGKTRWLFYDIVELQDGDNVIRRFRPIIVDKEEKDYASYSEELADAEDAFDSTKKPQIFYNRTKDICELTLNWQWAKLSLKDREEEWKMVKNMFLKVYNLKELKDNEETDDPIEIDDKKYTRVLVKTERLDVNKLTQAVFQDLPFGYYNYDIIVNSENIKTDSNVKKFSDEIKLLVNYDECVKFYQPSVKVANADGSKIIEFRWDLYHSSCEYATFFYGVYDAENDEVEDGGSTKEEEEEPKTIEEITDGSTSDGSTSSGNQTNTEFDVPLPDNSNTVRMQIVEFDGKYKNLNGQGVYSVAVGHGKNVFYGMKIKSDYIVAKDGQDYPFLDEGEKLIHDGIIYTKDL